MTESPLDIRTRHQSIRLHRRILVAGGIVFAAGYLALLIPFRLWRSDAYRELTRHTLVMQTAVGDIDYSIVGSGPAVLYVHSGYGGADRPLAIAGYRVVTPSRFGYLRTPLAAGASLEDQARAFAVLLDSLGIPQTAVVAGSAGGPSALAFVERYPDRVTSLVLLAAITKTRTHPVPKPSPFRVVTDIVFGADFTDWVLVQAVRLTPTGHDQESADTGQHRTLRMRLTSIRENWVSTIASGPWSQRYPGFAFDRRRAAILEVRDPLAVTAPTLIIHGTKDRAVDFGHAQSAARRIPGARLVAVEGAGHGFPSPHRQAVDSLVAEFLREYGPPPGRGRP